MGILDGRVALVAGAGQGAGRGIARAIAKDDATIPTDGGQARIDWTIPLGEKNG